MTIDWSNRAEAELAQHNIHPDQLRDKRLRDNPRSHEALAERDQANRPRGWYDEQDSEAD